MNSKVRKVIHIVVDVLVILVLLISAFTMVLALSSKASGGVPNIFGKCIIGVETNSMHGDKSDSFDENALIFCDKVEKPKVDSFKEGDVITFKQDLNNDGVKELITHRIYKINDDGSYWTKGDNNDTYDQDPSNAVVFPNKNYYDVVAVYRGAHIPVVGGFVNLLQTQTGFFWCILFPMILFFIYQAVRVVLNAMAYSKEKGMEQAKKAVENAELTEEQKQRAIEEYLAKQGKKPDSKDSDNTEANSDTPAEEPAEAAEEEAAEADESDGKSSEE